MSISTRRASYVEFIPQFLTTDRATILGYLIKSAEGDVTTEQRNAWLAQIDILHASLSSTHNGIICFEFIIPRIGKRADNIIKIGNQIIVLEFKVGATRYDNKDCRQVIDYALDLANFYEACHQATITPILVATNAPDSSQNLSFTETGVRPTALANKHSLRTLLHQILPKFITTIQDDLRWLASRYQPTPTIIEASQALYRGHDVTEISHSEAGADNLGATTTAITQAIEQAKAKNRKVIILVSGVPGAGKTLAGLNLVCQRHKTDADDKEHAVFLSGNGPLVKVLQEALARDEVTQAAAHNLKSNKESAHCKAKAFIQNVHHFRDDNLATLEAPVERVVVFDEAQRAWNQAQASKFMQKKRGQSDFNQSEPDFLIGVMNRHVDWAAIVCLIGGGQEINTGEAGLEEWLCALRDNYLHWEIYMPSHINTQEYLPHFDITTLGNRVTQNPALHLSVSLRSFRAERLSTAVSAIMSTDSHLAQIELAAVLPRFPIVITRSLAQGKAWVEQRARGSERYGLLASSGARRLKPLGINMDTPIDPCHWFLNDETDVRSSYYLEDAASEFDAQGLELDWTVVVWDGDLIHKPGSWIYRAFKGTRWQNINEKSAQKYRLNAYRVLLTRARQGMAIVIPEGDPNDPTRLPEFYDSTWRYFLELGLPILRDEYIHSEEWQATGTSTTETLDQTVISLE
ncbi:DUF2075 domain-containing protein [Azohydromonas aeria]|uniref:DUF2075 domain-containing protein n=1 Tax=Azohydromonas aeria TaxID=2590212 RepID=UPI0018DFBAD5|nr:DUF2075 domain-containing protein [Azohydromonas aeria]